MKNIYIVILALIAINTTSCDSFLDVNPKSQVVNDDMFSDERGIKDAMYGVYSTIVGESLYGLNITFKIPEVLSQNIDGPDDRNFRALAQFDYIGSQDITDPVWVQGYKAISHINNIIINLEAKEEGSIENLNVFLGEAYGLRALLHSDIVKLFAEHIETNPNANGIPYVKTYNFNKTPTSSVSKVYDYIIDDLKKSKELLSDYKDYIDYPRLDPDNQEDDYLKLEQIHFNYYAATALLARVYWMMGDLEKAKVEALEVIKSEKFPLADKNEVLTHLAGVLSGKETIFGIYSQSYFATSKKYFYENNSWESFSPSISEVHKHTVETVYSQYTEGSIGDDLRLGWFKPVNELSKSINLIKLVDLIRINKESMTPDSRGLVEGLSILRIPEMYYIVAEAELAAGQAGEAGKYIDQVIYNRGLSRLSERATPMEVTKELIYNEREKEYFGEGFRWTHLKKLNKSFYSNVSLHLVEPEPSIFVLPIPKEEIEN